MNKKQITKNQHFVPQVYLRKFGPDGLLDQYYIKDKCIIRKRSIKKHLCCEDWFYEFLIQHKNKKEFIRIINHLEDRLCEIENKYNHIYNKIIREIEYPLETDKKVELTKEDVLFFKRIHSITSGKDK